VNIFSWTILFLLSMFFSPNLICYQPVHPQRVKSRDHPFIHISFICSINHRMAVLARNNVLHVAFTLPAAQQLMSDWKHSEDQKEIIFHCFQSISLRNNSNNLLYISHSLLLAYHPKTSCTFSGLENTL